MTSRERRDSTSCVRDRNRNGFTLLELLVVIAIIAVLAGLLFPAVQSVLERAKKVQAKNDLTQIVTAVNAFYTEYGQSPLVGTVSTPDTTYGASGNNSGALFNELRAKTSSLNTRQIQFISPSEDATQTSPKGKIGSDNQFHDPWGNAYVIRIDADYDNQVSNPYNSNTGAGPDKIRQGIIAWSVGKDTQIGSKNDKNFANSDDVISWQ
jgi:prepilin-type N-terminal cleavage/methylation domain-containing protein